MKILAAIFVGLIVLLQYPLWLGKGGWLRVWDLDRQVQSAKERNVKAQARNNALDAEVRDLKHGFAAIEERARYELGMIKPNEVFYQVVEPQPGTVSKEAAQPGAPAQQFGAAAGKR